MDSERREYLEAHFSHNAPARPILTSLNGDNSWLFSFPYTSSSQSESQKAYYHIVFEPWLKGASTVLGAWFVHITLTAAPTIPDAQAIEQAIWDIEEVATGKQKIELVKSSKEGQDVYTGGIDAIMLGFHYGEHTHVPTLLTFDPRIPVIATPEASKIISGLSHFRSVALIQDFSSTATNWRLPELHPGSPCPDWLTPLRLSGHYELNFCNAIIWSHGEPNAEKHEVILVSPHGTRLDEGPLQAFLDSEPKTEKLGMLHALKENYAARWQAALGAKGGLALYRRVGGVRYWIVHHSSKLKYNGLLMWSLWTNDVHRTIDWAVQQEQKQEGVENLKPTMVDVKNGSCFVLE